MDKIIKNILKKIEDEGFEAYLVGGYVRDYLLGIKSQDIDICTNALPKDLYNIFPNNSNSNTYGGFNLKIKKYNIDITTYRKELKYQKRKPTEIIYLNNLEDDVQRRDFTINAICMNKEEKIIDLTDGIKDLNERKIKIIGNVDEKLIEDPLRILRAIRLCSILNFKLDDKLYNSIKKNYKLIENLSDIRVKQELNKILLNKNFMRGLILLKELKILEILKIDFNDINYVDDLSGMWAQLEFFKSYSFTKQELTNIINIRQIITSGVINNEVLYNYGLYNSLVAGKILNIDRKLITKMYNKLPIKSEKDLQINNNEIINILNIKPSKIIKDIRQELIKNILNKRLKNKNNELKKYILNRKEM